MGHPRRVRHAVLTAYALANLACGFGGGAGAEPAGESAAHCREGAACTEYDDASLAEAICDGTVGSGACPTDGMLASCEIAPGMTQVYYPSGPRSTEDDYYSMDIVADCPGAIVRGVAPRVPSIEYPALPLGTWVEAALELSDDVEVLSSGGRYETPYDVYRVELEAGRTYLFELRGEYDIDLRALRDIDPNGLSVQALHDWGPRVEWDSEPGENERWVYTATRSGPHVLMVESGVIRDGVLDVVHGAYAVRVAAR